MIAATVSLLVNFCHENSGEWVLEQVQTSIINNQKIVEDKPQGVLPETKY